MRQPVSPRPLVPTWLSFSLAAAFIISGLTVTLLAFLTIQEMLAAPLNPLDNFIGDGGTGSGSLPEPGIIVMPPELILEEPIILPEATPLPIYPIHDQRVTILVMGIDRRPGEPFISRTDTMIVMSINPADNSAVMLSIPRDLYVQIPGHGRNRINTAFVFGSRGNNPAAGAELAMETVEYNLGIPIDHYLMVDFSAVVRGVDAIGGIEVDVPFDIYDPTFPDMNYGYDPLYIPAGRQHLDGALTLKYARTRHVDNDFGRANRQQQVVLAVRSKVLSLGVTQLLGQLPFFYQQLNEGIRTDLSIDQMLTLAQAASQVPTENIRSEVIDYDYVVGHRTEEGASVLVMINDRVARLIEELFYEQ
ncbi:MAG: LCP family protein [Anaerolineae bacterium]|nr:LCP family protein [Anaerolineae bacterium]